MASRSALRFLAGSSLYHRVFNIPTEDDNNSHGPKFAARRSAPRLTSHLPIAYCVYTADAGSLKNNIVKLHCKHGYSCFGGSITVELRMNLEWLAFGVSGGKTAHDYS